MIQTFFATLNPILTLFACIAIGYALRKLNILPDGAGKVMAKLETWVFCPALSFVTMARYCTLDTLTTHAVNIAFATLGVMLAISIAIPLGRLMVKKKCSERGVYYYALAFANSGYFGDPVISALFGDEMLSYYKIFCLPISVMIYTWGISVLTPQECGSNFKKLINPPMIAVIAGALVGISGIFAYFPTFITGSLDSLKVCMGPVAMLLAGYTIAGYSIKAMLKKRKVYIATALRLIVLPAVIVGAVFGVKSLFCLIPGVAIDNTVIYLTLVATAAPLGLNTVVFPEAYGGDPETGASMAMVSHTFVILTLPLLFALVERLFGTI